MVGVNYTSILYFDNTVSHCVTAEEYLLPYVCYSDKNNEIKDDKNLNYPIFL